MLINTFKKYFTENYSKFLWTILLFWRALPIHYKRRKRVFIELSRDEGLKMEFAKLQLFKFWLRVTNESKKALLFLIPFSTTYLCETDFLQCRKLKINIKIDLMLTQTCAWNWLQLNLRFIFLLKLCRPIIPIGF